MAVRSMVEVDVNDDRFKEFLALFDKYTKTLDKQPAAWKKVGNAIGGVTDELEEQAKATNATAANIDEAAKSEKHLNTEAKAANREFSALAKHTQNIAGSLKDGALWLLKWSAIGGIGAGLLGAGSLFGLGGLAQRTSGIRRESMGIGVDTGTLRALRTNYGSAVDVDSMLGKINEARNDVSQRWLFSANGISPGDLRNKSNAELLQQLVPNLRDRMLRSNGNAANMPGLTGFADVDTLTRLGKMSGAEIAGMSAGVDRDRSAMGVRDETDKAWQDFQKQLTRAGETIETVLIRGLVPLTGPLSQLSATIATTLKDFLGNPNMGRWIEEFGRGIESAAKYIGSGDLQKDLQSFGTSIRDISASIKTFTDWFNGERAPWREKAVNATADFMEWLSPVDKYPNQQQAAPTLSSLEASRGLPAGLLDRMYLRESSRGANVPQPLFGYTTDAPAGPFQQAGAFAKDYKIKDRYDFNDASRGAADGLADYRRRYNGDIIKAVAAYNAGPGRIDDLVEKYGDKWRMHLPAETDQYLKATIEINNATGGNAVVNANQAGRQN